MNPSILAKTQKRGSALLSCSRDNAQKYTIEVFTSVSQLGDDWQRFAKQHDNRYSKEYIGIPEKAALTDFGYFYVVAKAHNSIVALFYFQTLLIRKEYYPNFSNISFAAKNLYCLIAAHNYQLLINGHLFIADFPGAVFNSDYGITTNPVLIFENVISKVKRACDSSILIIKDTHSNVFEGLQNNPKFKLMPDDLLMEMEVPAAWKSIDDYIAALSKKYAVRAKKIEQSTAHFLVEELEENQIRQHSKLLNNLYMNVMSKSSFKPGMLHMSYFADMKAVLKENFIVSVWKLNNEVVGFSSYIISNKSIELYYIGIDYKINRSHHLYQCMLQKSITDAIAMQRSILKLGRTAYEAKAIAGAKPVVKRNFFQISNPILRIGYKYAADYFLAENSTNWQARTPFK